MAIGTKIKAQKYSLYGSMGLFSILPKPKWTICHFSTKASSRNDGDGGNCLSLLKELKPMRERVEETKINDMSSLLQRDLSDNRVANELIPYLMNNDTGIGFFPGVLVALLPKDFLNASSQSAIYPKKKIIAEDDNEIKYDFDGHWTVSKYKVKDDETGVISTISLGQLNIDPDKTDLIVLDGQHRANAFRYVTSTFPDALNDSEIYSIFYKTCNSPPIEYDAELPVTLVWFESDAQEAITPLMISRKLFVDVNTNAKPVNESRNILLDDQKLQSLCTQNFYTLLASKSFSIDELSLLQSAFDAENDVSISKLCLFTPKLIMYANSYFAVGKDEYNSLSCTVPKDYYRYQNNTNRLNKIIKASKIKNKKDLFNKPFDNHQISQALNETLSKYIYTALNDFVLIKKHLIALKTLDSWIFKQSSTIKEVWKKVYCGGEGLYSNIRNIDLSLAPYKKTVSNYVSAIEEIETEFSKIRRSLFDTECQNLVDTAYDTFSSQATITGFLMAMSSFAETKGWEYEDKGIKHLTSKSYVELLNMTNHSNWIKILTKYKEKAAGTELNPKMWPVMRNIFLRVIQNNSTEVYYK